MPNNLPIIEKILMLSIKNIEMNSFVTIIHV